MGWRLQGEDQCRLELSVIGSGGGIKQIKAKTVDFGASDMPLKAEDLEGRRSSSRRHRRCGAGGESEGVAPGQMKMTGGVLGGHLYGQDQEVERSGDRRSNGVKLPDENITVVVAPMARVTPSCLPITFRR